jgi:hypothetical protein
MNRHGGTLPKGGHVMAQLHERNRTLTLQASLEEVAHLGEGYLLSGAGEEWRASDLLECLQQEHPDLLGLPVALVQSDATGEGAVFEVGLDGQALADVPLYRIERRSLTVLPL